MLSPRKDGSSNSTRFEYYENNLPAELNAKIEALHKTVETVDIILYHFITKFIVILIYLYVLWQQHWALSLAVFVWLINFVFSICAMGSPEIACLGAKWAQMCAQNSGRRVEILRNILVIKTFSSPRREMNFVSEDTAKPK